MCQFPCPQAYSDFEETPLKEGACQLTIATVLLERWWLPLLVSVGWQVFQGERYPLPSFTSGRGSEPK